MVADVDHAANADGAGLDLRPTRVVLFGNPALGTPLMQQNQTAGIDLPQKVLVYENGEGEVYAAYNTTDYLASRHGLAGAETLPMIAGALETLTENATGGAVKQPVKQEVHEGEGLVARRERVQRGRDVQPTRRESSRATPTLYRPGSA